MHVCIKHGRYSREFYLFWPERRNLWGRGLIIKINRSELHISMSSPIYSAGRFCILLTYTPVSLSLSFPLALHLTFFLHTFYHQTLASAELISCSAEHAAAVQHTVLGVIKYCNSGNLISHVLIEALHKPLRLDAYMYFVSQ
jgi:hypothetical protein